MSVFCVYGIKMQRCIERARKIIPTQIEFGPTFQRIRFTSAQHNAYADLLAEYLYLDDEARTIQIAPAFDAPQFARDWIDVAKKTDSARRMSIMVKKPKVDKKGDQIRRKGSLVMSWQEWSSA